MSLPKALFTSMLCVGLLGSVAATAQAAKTTPQVKVFTTKTTSTTVVAPAALGQYFQESALVDADCGKGYQPLAIGIASATHPLAAQDLGFVGMSVYASGAAGSATTRLQALCVRGGKPPTYTGRAVTIGTDGSGPVARATVSCRTGYAALGAALAHGHAPAFGAYASTPNGTRRWTYSARLPASQAGQLAGKETQLGYPRVACVRATGVTTSEFRGEVAPGSTVQGTATCKSGRVLGWGVDLAASSSSSSRAGGWAIPTIERARFDGTRKMSFGFARKAEGVTTPTAVRAQIVCGTLPRG